VIHQNVRLSDITISDVLDLGQLPVFFHIMDPVSARDISDPVETQKDWQRFKSLATHSILPRIQIDTI
jgi:hypothetical protein